MIKFIIFIIRINLIISYFKKIIFTLITINLLFLINFILINNFLFKNFYWININYILGIDKISFMLILLTLWILNLSIISRKIPISNKYKLVFFNILIILINILFIRFRSINIIIFYIFFESRLIPIIIIIIGWGIQIDKIQARIYIIFYTLFGSLPLIIILIYIYFKFNSLIFNFLTIKNSIIYKFNLYIIINSAFFIKLPIFLAHLWLPKAHVEAPIRGSIILAGIILKLGSYGIYRNIIIFPNIYIKYNFFFIIISILGRLISCLICINQTDLKIIVAYSSIVHINLILTRIITLIFISFKGRIIIIVSHGLCSSGIFFLVNLNYEKIYSRNIFINKGFLSIIPSLSLWWFLIFSSNFSAPPSLNLFREIFLINCLTQWNLFTIIIIIIILFFRISYSIFIFAFSQLNIFNKNISNFKKINCREYIISFIHWIPLNILFISLNLF